MVSTIETSPAGVGTASVRFVKQNHEEYPYELRNITIHCDYYELKAEVTADESWVFDHWEITQRHRYAYTDVGTHEVVEEIHDYTHDSLENPLSNLSDEHPWPYNIEPNEGYSRSDFNYEAGLWSIIEYSIIRIVAHFKQRCVVKVHTEGVGGGDTTLAISEVVHDQTYYESAEKAGIETDATWFVHALPDSGFLLSKWTKDGDRIGSWRNYANYGWTWQLGIQHINVIGHFRPATNMPVYGSGGQIVFNDYRYRGTPDAVVGHF